GRLDPALSANGATRVAARAIVAAAVRQRPRRIADARRLLEDPQTARSRRRAAAHAQSARRPALVRDAPARARRGPARDPDDARPRGSVDDADLHARPRGAAPRGLRSLPPSCLICYA